MKKPLVYLAAPYTKGDPAINTHCQVQLFLQLLSDAVVTPLSPLLSHLVHLIQPQTYETWMRLSFEELNHCDACFASFAVHKPLNYEQRVSEGMSRELDYCETNGIPVFDSKIDLYEWAREWGAK